MESVKIRPIQRPANRIVPNSAAKTAMFWLKPEERSVQAVKPKGLKVIEPRNTPHQGRRPCEFMGKSACKNASKASILSSPRGRSPRHVYASTVQELGRPSFCLSTHKRYKGREYPQASEKTASERRTKELGVRTTHSTQGLPVMGQAGGRGCLNSTKERNNFMPDTELEYNTKAKLSLITKKAAKDPKLKFISLIHLLNDEEYLYQCFKELERGKAAGIDERTKESYTEQEIRQAIAQVVQAMKTRKYKPRPVRRVFIPKSNGKLRPLGIPTVMDKVIQLAVAKILEPIFEPVFLNTSYGYRTKRNAHEALKAVNDMLMGQKVNRVIDADIKAFFDHVNHDWMAECLKQRIADPRFLALIRRMLKAGVMYEGRFEETEHGTPQGGIISPILANIYLHYVLDLWFEKKLKSTLRGYAGMVRYADDFVIGCQYPYDAEWIVKELKDRLTKFDLMLAEDKTRVITFGRFARERRAERGKGKPETFTFLGFTHYCSTTRKGSFVVRHKTSVKKYRESVKRLKEWMRSMKNMRPLPELWNTLYLKLKGHYQYYGISGNLLRLRSFECEAEQLAYKWLNRRSQRKSWNWEQFRNYLERYPLPTPKICYALYPSW